MEENDKENNDVSSDMSDRLKQAELIEKMGEISSQNSKHLIHCLTIIGQV